MRNLVFWNPVNLVDGEANWFLTFLAILTLAAVATHFWRWLCMRLHHKFTQKDELVKDAAMQATVGPVAFYIWFVTIIQCIDLISDRFLSDSLASYLKLLLGTAAVLTLGWFLFRLKVNITKVLLARSQQGAIAMQPGKVYGIAKLFSIVISIIVLLLLMEVTGVSVTTLFAVGGISGLAIAFASQEMIANFFGGIMIHIIQPFAIHDDISLPSSSLEGHVEEIGWYETRLRGKDMQPVYIPNSLFSKAYVINSTRRTHRQIKEKISIRHEDLAKAGKIVDDLRKLLVSDTDIDSRQKLLVHVFEVGSYSVDIYMTALSIYLNETKFLAHRDRVLFSAFEVIKANGAEIAVPIEGIFSIDKRDH